MYVYIIRNGVLIGPRAFGARVYGQRCANIYTSTHACQIKMRPPNVHSSKLYEGDSNSVCVCLKLVLIINV